MTGRVLSEFGSEELSSALQSWLSAHSLTEFGPHLAEAGLFEIEELLEAEESELTAAAARGGPGCQRLVAEVATLRRSPLPATIREKTLEVCPRQLLGLAAVVKEDRDVVRGTQTFLDQHGVQLQRVARLNARRDARHWQVSGSHAEPRRWRMGLTHGSENSVKQPFIVPDYANFESRSVVLLSAQAPDVRPNRRDDSAEFVQVKWVKREGWVRLATEALQSRRVKLQIMVVAGTASLTEPSSTNLDSEAISLAQKHGFSSFVEKVVFGLRGTVVLNTGSTHCKLSLGPHGAAKVDVCKGPTLEAMLDSMAQVARATSRDDCRQWEVLQVVSGRLSGLPDLSDPVEFADGAGCAGWAKNASAQTPRKSRPPAGPPVRGTSKANAVADVPADEKDATPEDIDVLQLFSICLFHHVRRSKVEEDRMHIEAGFMDLAKGLEDYTGKQVRVMVQSMTGQYAYIHLALLSPELADVEKELLKLRPKVTIVQGTDHCAEDIRSAVGLVPQPPLSLQGLLSPKKQKSQYQAAEIVHAGSQKGKLGRQPSAAEIVQASSQKSKYHSNELLQTSNPRNNLPPLHAALALRRKTVQGPNDEASSSSSRNQTRTTSTEARPPISAAIKTHFTRGTFAKPDASRIRDLPPLQSDQKKALLPFDRKASVSSTMCTENSFLMSDSESEHENEAQELERVNTERSGNQDMGNFVIRDDIRLVALDIWRKLDFDKDGSISVVEFGWGFDLLSPIFELASLDFGPSAFKTAAANGRQAQEYFEFLDESRDGKLQEEEFIAHFVKASEMRPSEAGELLEALSSCSAELEKRCSSGVLMATEEGIVDDIVVRAGDQIDVIYWLMAERVAGIQKSFHCSEILGPRAFMALIPQKDSIVSSEGVFAHAIALVELNNASATGRITMALPKHVPFACRDCACRIYVTPPAGLAGTCGLAAGSLQFLQVGDDLRMKVFGPLQVVDMASNINSALNSYVDDRASMPASLRREETHTLIERIKTKRLQPELSVKCKRELLPRLVQVWLSPVPLTEKDMVPLPPSYIHVCNAGPGGLISLEEGPVLRWPVSDYTHDYLLMLVRPSKDGDSNPDAGGAMNFCYAAGEYEEIWVDDVDRHASVNLKNLPSGRFHAYVKTKGVQGYSAWSRRSYFEVMSKGEVSGLETDLSKALCVRDRKTLTKALRRASRVWMVDRSLLQESQDCMVALQHEDKLEKAIEEAMERMRAFEVEELERQMVAPVDDTEGVTVDADGEAVIVPVPEPPPREEPRAAELKEAQFLAEAVETAKSIKGIGMGWLKKARGVLGKAQGKDLSVILDSTEDPVVLKEAMARVSDIPDHAQDDLLQQAQQRLTGLELDGELNYALVSDNLHHVLRLFCEAQEVVDSMRGAWEDLLQKLRFRLVDLGTTTVVRTIHAQNTKEVEAALNACTKVNDVVRVKRRDESNDENWFETACMVDHSVITQGHKCLKALLMKQALPEIIGPLGDLYYAYDAEMKEKARLEAIALAEAKAIEDAKANEKRFSMIAQSLDEGKKPLAAEAWLQNS